MNSIIKCVQEDIFNNQLEEEDSASIVNQCILALTFLAQIVKDELLLHSFEFVKEFMNYV